MKRAIATPPDQETEYEDLTADEITARQAEELAATIDAINKARSTIRDRYVYSGLTVSGITIATDDLTQQRLIAVRILAKEDSNYTVKWKTTNGFVILDAPTIIAIADAVRAHVQKCFDVEDSLSSQTFNTVDDLETAFAAGMAA